MSVQSVQDNGSVKGTIDLADHVTVSANGKSATTTTKDCLTEQPQYDASESPNKRLAHILQQASRLPIVAAGGNSKAKPTQCSQGTTLVAASRSVRENFCIDNEATQKVKGQYPTWSEARGFCEAAGKFLLTYEQHKLGAKSTDSSVVRTSGDWEWVLKSDGDDSEGQVGGFLRYDYTRHISDELLDHDNPDRRLDNIAFRCGGVPSSQD